MGLRFGKNWRGITVCPLNVYFYFLLLFVFGVGLGGREGGWSVSPQGAPRKETVAERTFVPRHKGGTLVPQC